MKGIILASDKGTACTQLHLLSVNNCFRFLTNR